MTMKKKKELEVPVKKTVQKANGEPTREGLRFIPHVDIIEDKDQITLRADLPGVKKENVDIDVREGVLTLTADINTLPENWKSVYAEYEFGGYSRRFSLSNEINQEKINATMDNGVLTLELTKADEYKPRKIEIR